MTDRPRIERLVWDESHRLHLTKHDVCPEEAEEVVASEPGYRETYKSRLQAVGPTSSGRILSLVVAPVPEQPTHYYVFFARPAGRKERAAFARRHEGK